MLLTMRAVAIPEPIRPPPITATFFMCLGLSPMSETLGTFKVARWAKKT
uniref:Uncharacterized protein n=1 Tax=Rhizophora mucronata TaxID=61149 RepID=A0A2P2IMP4_RHIMU